LHSESFIIYRIITVHCKTYLICPPFVECKMSLQVFSSICGVNVSIAATILSFVLSMEDTGVLQKMSLTYSHRKKSSGIISGKRRGHRIGPSRSTERPGQFISRNSRTIRTQYGDVSVKLFELCFHIPKAVSFYFSDFKVIGHGNPDNNL
jgi:hypothetical protein